MTAKTPAVRYSARTIADATETVRLIHTTIARYAVTLMTKDTRIQPVGAVTAMIDDGFTRLTTDQPHVMTTYRNALTLLGIGRGDMDYHRFLTYVDARVRLQLTTDRKVAGSAK